MKIGIIYNGDCTTGLECFTPNELMKLNSFRQEQKKRKWHRGRLLTKYLVSHPDTNRPVIDLNTIVYRDFSSDFKQIEILPKSSFVRKPVIYVNGVELQQKVSVSHQSNFTIACLSETEYSIDIEPIREKPAVFYDQNYSHYEKRVGMLVSSKYEIDITAFYTFLWTVKECVIKSKTDLSLTVWDTPQIELLINEDHLQAIKHRTTEIKYAIIKSKIRIKDEMLVAHIITQNYKDHILTSLTFPETH